MDLVQILVFGGLALSASLAAAAIPLKWNRWRPWFLLISSIAAIYWLQPATPIYHLDFWFPTLTLSLTVLGWSVTAQRPLANWRSELTTGLVVIAVVLIIGATRFTEGVITILPSTPPNIVEIGTWVIAAAIISGPIFRYASGKRPWLFVVVLLFIFLFIILKTGPLAQATSVGLHLLTGQSISLASGLDLRWVGFSYIAFRLLHTFIDRINGRLATYSLSEYLTYAIFFPTFTAGPIDRVQRFSEELRRPFTLTAQDFFDGGQRIGIGLFKKFVLADGLAVFALNETNALQVQSTGWLWVLLYAYALRIYFDFSGYTDIAIGLGRWLGFRLPENFDRPYLKRNLTLFWNSWHITLAQWFRAYFFNPVTRALRRHENIPLWIIILVGQIGTMVLIGLWHGVTWNYAIWGLWHAVGLFIHSRWSEYKKSRPARSEASSFGKAASSTLSTLFTFHYVTLGFVWFCLPDLSLSWQVFMKLFGVGV